MRPLTLCTENLDPNVVVMKSAKDRGMAEQQILYLKPAPRFEQVGGEPSERMQDRKHHSQS